MTLLIGALLGAFITALYGFLRGCEPCKQCEWLEARLLREKAWTDDLTDAIEMSAGYWTVREPANGRRLYGPDPIL